MSTKQHRRASALLKEGFTQRDVAAELGVTPRTIRNWRESGKVEVARTNGASDEDTDSLSEAKRRKQNALAEKHEQEAARRRGELVERSHLVDVLLKVRRVLDSIPGRMSQDVAEKLGIEPREALPMLEDVADTAIDEVRMDLERWAREGAADRVETPLPRDVPHLRLLVNHGLETVEDVEECEDLTELSGIGEARAEEIRRWMDGE